MIPIPAPVPVLLLGGWRASAFAAGLAICAAGWGVQSWRLSSAHKERDAARQTAELSVALNATNVHTIDTLRRANGQWASIHAESEQKAALALAAVARERDALRAEIEKRRAQREHVYETDQSAAAWGRTAVPRAVADSLRR